jgi:acyl transferase domain-containing protein/SAM-dependent methyltransferase/acyl carrier protein
MTNPSSAIAIIGMRGRYPGAGDLEQFWENLAGGKESITRLSPDEMRAAGVPDDVMRLPGYVNASPILKDADRFDAEFFGFSARDASLTDPQHRVFMETAWEALEDAGYAPASFAGPIGVFGGCEMSTYLYQLSQNASALGFVDGMQLMVTNDKDHLCTQTSYRLNLRGPSVVVQTTCSTSLVAVTMACESLLGGRCDMALAGGVTVRVPQRGGYYYVAGSILSPDGHCRPFDSRAQGTIVGSGVGIVVLRRLTDALDDGDSIRGVVLGFGLNNDGSDKVGYTAPGVKGQVAAIADAYRMAGVSPDTIGYVEAHGTGTILGDPIEMSALTEVFRRHTDRRGFCGIGSVKSNVGHLSCAAGVTGLMKAVMAMEHGAIPPTVHYKEPNPALQLTSSPFFVTRDLHPWARDGTPRRAAVSAFGVGGTNAHIVLEEAPAPAPSPSSRSHQLIVLSARNEAGADSMIGRLARYLTRHPERDLADVAYTLQVGRRDFGFRRSAVVDGQDRARAVAALRSVGGTSSHAASKPGPVVFMFPGQGSQYPGMAAGLYRSESVVRDTIDKCCEALVGHMGLDLRHVLLAGSERSESAAAELRDTALAQPALFVVQYALAQLWGSWGIQPSAMIGHSIGEYVAATLAGVLRLEDSLHLLAQRGRFISSLPSGSMLGVMAPAEAVSDLMSDDVSLAADNAPGLCVLSGPGPAIDSAEATLAARSVVTRRLNTSHAFHSSMMEPILDDFEAAVALVPQCAPTVPYVSTLTGTWMGESPPAGYWSAQIRSPVAFGVGLRCLMAEGSVAGPAASYLEVGPGRALGSFVAQTAQALNIDVPVLSSLPAATEAAADTEVMLSSLGALWERGAVVNWPALHAGERRRRVSLPTYPFERQTYWIGRPDCPGADAPSEARDPARWFFVPEWTGSLVPDSTIVLDALEVLVLHDGEEVGREVAAALSEAGARVLIKPSPDEVAGDDFSDVAAVVDCRHSTPPAATDLETAAAECFLQPLRLGVKLAGRPGREAPLMLVVRRGTAEVTPVDHLDAARAFGIGAVKVLPQEHPGLRLTHIDVDDDDTVAHAIVDELAAGLPDSEVALRGGRRLVRTYAPVEIAEAAPPAGLPAHPVVLITGGLGHMGLILAEAVFAGIGARLVLVGRSVVPPPDEWAARSESADVGEEQRSLLRRLAVMRAERDDVLVLAADFDDGAAVRRAVDAAIEHFGGIDMVIHGAANVGPAAFGSAADTGPEVVAAQLSPKIKGLLHLVDAMHGREPSRWVVHGSISSVLGGLGLAAYSGANAVLEAMVTRQARTGASWQLIGWDAWDNAGESQNLAGHAAIQPAEGREAFLRLLGADTGANTVVSVFDLDDRINTWVRMDATSASSDGVAHPRPNLSTIFVAPGTETEKALAEIWASQLGLSTVGIHDRFFDLGGHSLLAVQMSAEIRNHFGVDVPVLETFEAPTVAELSVRIDDLRAGGERTDQQPTATPAPDPSIPSIDGQLDGDASPGEAAKARYRTFYDDVSRRLAASGVGSGSFFLNYGYVSVGDEDEAVVQVPDGELNPNSIRLALELVGSTVLNGRPTVDVGCGRGGIAMLMAKAFGADVVGVDLSPEAIAFCRQAHVHPTVRFEVGDAEDLPLDDASCLVVTNAESSHTYPDLRAFLCEVRRVLQPGGWFLHTDLLPTARWPEVRAILGSLGLVTHVDRVITPSVLASCDEISLRRAKVFGSRTPDLDNFLAVPGSPVYEQMRSGSWEYRIMRSQLSPAARVRQANEEDSP